MRTFFLLLILFPLFGRCEESTPPSALHRLEAIEIAINNSDDTSTVGGRKLMDAYARLFPGAYRKKALVSKDAKRLQELFSAANMLEFYSGSPGFADQMRTAFDAIRGLDEPRAGDYTRMYQAYLSSEQFEKARDFLAKYPNRAVQGFPEVVGESGRSPGMNLWKFDSEKNQVHQEPFHLPNGAYIVVMSSPFCHFAQNAANDLAMDAGLRTLMAGRSLWLTRIDRIFSPSAVKAWDARNPYFPMSVAANLPGWEQIDTWETPTFYLFYNGVLIRKINGWPAGGHKAEISEFFSQPEITAAVAR